MDKPALTDTLAPELDMTDTSAPQPDMTEKECKVEGMKDENAVPTYNMTDQEQRLQCEEKLNIYMSTFGYEGDDLDLDSDMDLDSKATGIPIPGVKKKIRKIDISFPSEEE